MRFTLRQLLLLIVLIAFLSSVGSAETELKNEISGILNEDGSPYHVTENVYVPEDGLLKIESGVEVNFEPGTQLEVYGTLNILGTANAPVILSPSTIGNPWKGITIRGKDADGGIIRYARISGCTIGIQFSDVTYEVTDTKINALEGALLLENDSNVTLVDDSTFVIADKLSATAFKVIDSYTTAYNCYFELEANVLGQNAQVQGIIFDGAEGVFRNNHLYVYSSSAVHAIYINDSFDLAIAYCAVKLYSDSEVVEHKSAAIRVAGSSGLVLDHMSLDLYVEHSTAVGLFGSGNVFIDFRNSIIANTAGTPIGSNFAFFIENNEERTWIEAYYNCLYNVSIPPADHDFIDNYFYILDNPEWENLLSMDYHLRETSPCIDAGDPLFALDPDGTRSDLGCFYFEQEPSNASPGSGSTTPEIFALQPAYPNPFNSSVRFGLNVDKNRDVVIRVYDVLGREISTVYSGYLQRGHHTFHWNGFSGFKPVSSGTYFIRVNSESQVFSQRISLVH